MKQLTFYFDPISPYAALGFEALPEALAGHSVEVRPGHGQRVVVGLARREELGDGAQLGRGGARRRVAHVTRTSRSRRRRAGACRG